MSMTKNVTWLDEWALVSSANDDADYMAPETPDLQHCCLTGIAYGSERFRDGESVKILGILGLDLAESLGINLALAIGAKMAYNVTRPHRHGGKRA